MSHSGVTAGLFSIGVYFHRNEKIRRNDSSHTANLSADNPRVYLEGDGGVLDAGDQFVDFVHQVVDLLRTWLATPDDREIHGHAVTVTGDYCILGATEGLQWPQRAVDHPADFFCVEGLVDRDPWCIERDCTPSYVCLD